MRRTSTNASLVSLALVRAGIEPDPEIALIPLRGVGEIRNVVAPESGPLPVPMSTNLYTREGKARVAEVRALVPCLDVDTIKGMLRNEGAAWDKAEAMFKKAHGL